MAVYCVRLIVYEMADLHQLDAQLVSSLPDGCKQGSQGRRIYVVTLVRPFLSRVRLLWRLWRAGRGIEREGLEG